MVSDDKKCPPGKIRNPKTNYCVKRDGKIGKAIIAAQKRKVSRKQSKRKKKTIKELRAECRKLKLVYDRKEKKCRESKRGKRKVSSRKSPKRKVSRKQSKRKKKTIKELRAECRKLGLIYDRKEKMCRESKVGKRKVSRRKKGSISSRKLKPCKSYQYRDPITNRCRNKPGHKRIRKPKKRVRSRLIREELPERWKQKRKTSENCITRSKLDLRDHQRKVVDFLQYHDGLLIMHGTGSGKTLTAITASQCYLDKDTKRKVVFVGPASLVDNFKKEMRKYGVQNPQKYEFYSYDKFLVEARAGRPINMKNKMLIVDEAHNLRNPRGLKSKAVVTASTIADKRLLLTATPFVNKLTDFIPLINMVYGKHIVGTRIQFYRGETDEWLGDEPSMENLATLRYLLTDKIDIFMYKDPKYYPHKIEHTLHIPMTTEYYRRYVRIVQGAKLFGILFKNPSYFYNGYRRAVNRAGPAYYSMKIKKILPILKKGKTLIYTNWVSFGVRPIADALKDNNISFDIFYGEVKMEERQDIVNNFNSGKFDVLIVTKAGGEGLDLKGVRSVVVIDPPWNDAALQQIIGRAIRYKSHAHLRTSQRKVDVYFMILDKPKFITHTEVPSGDKLLYAIIGDKNKRNAIFLELLQDLSI